MNRVKRFFCFPPREFSETSQCAMPSHRHLTGSKKSDLCAVYNMDGQSLCKNAILSFRNVINVITFPF